MSFGNRYPQYIHGIPNYVAMPLSQYHNAANCANQPRFFRSTYNIRSDLRVNNYADPVTPVNNDHMHWDTYNYPFNNNGYDEDHRFNRVGGNSEVRQAPYSSVQGQPTVQNVSSYTSEQANNVRSSYHTRDVWSNKEKTNRNSKPLLENPKPLLENPTLKRKLPCSESSMQPSKVVVKQTKPSGTERQSQFNGSLQVTIQCNNKNNQSPSSSSSSREDYHTHLESTFHLEQIQLFHEIHEKKTRHITPKSDSVAAPKQNDPRIQKAAIQKPAEKTSYCQICKTKYVGGLIEHRQTASHKASKVRAKPYCAQCKIFLRSPAKFVLHCNSPSHKANRYKIKDAAVVQVANVNDDSVNKESAAEIKKSPTKIIDDAKDKDNTESKDEKSNEPTVQEKEEEKLQDSCRDCAETVLIGTVVETNVPLNLSSEHNGDAAADEIQREVKKSPIQPIGVSYIHPVKGFYCEICCKLFRDKYTARVVHCQSKLHHDNYKKAEEDAQRRQDEERNEDSHSPFPDKFIVWDDSEVDIDKDSVNCSKGIPFNELNNYEEEEENCN